MAGRIIYLEVDDEITSAAARIRDSESPRIAVVLPYASRVATSRINFRLLSRDALTHDKRLSIVSGDPATRALAASAGLPVFASVAEYDSSEQGADGEPYPATSVPVIPPRAPQPASAAARGPAPEPASDGTLGLVIPAAAVAAATAGSAGAAHAGLPGDTIRTAIPRVPVRPDDGPPARSLPPPMGGSPERATTAGASGRGGIRTPWLIGGAILALALLVGGVGTYLLLPSATIVVTPRTERVGPIPLTVVADTTATQPDPARAVVPARQITIPVSVNNTFSATGKRVALTNASGTVRFQNLDPTSTNRIPAGSIVRTGSGIRFRTQVSITVPSAALVGFQIFPSTASVKVTAVDGGTDGNVDPGTITVVPSGENPIFLKVSNPEATTGGTRQEFPRVTQADVDAALAALNLSLQQAFQEAMASPSLDAGGAKVFASTGTLGQPTPNVSTDTLVGQEVATFALSLSASGTVIAVDPALVSAIAETQLRTAVKTGHQLVAGSVNVAVGDAIVVGQSVSFPVQATADQVAVLDPAALRTLVLGKSTAEANAILAPYGQVKMTISPDWSGSVPSFESRVTLTIDQAVPVETPAPSASGTP
jgi:hypothetical protein